MRKILIITAWLCFSAAWAAEITGYTVIKVGGRKDCKVKTGDSFSEVVTGQAYKFGTILQTGRRTTVDLQFSEGNTFRLMPRTKLQIVQDVKDPKLKILKLDQGTVELKLDDFKGNKLKVETPTAVCGALGTRFIVTFEGEADHSADDPDKEDKIARLAKDDKTGSRASRFTCTKGKVFVASRFNVAKKEVEGKTFNAPEISAGTSFAAVIHEGVENSFADISVSRGKLDINLGGNEGANLQVAPEKDQPARFICALEKSSDDVQTAVFQVKQGSMTSTVTRKEKKGFFKKKVVEVKEETVIKPEDGAVLYHEATVYKPKEDAKESGAYLAAAQIEGELHSKVEVQKQAGEVNPEDVIKLNEATAEATRLRKQLMTARAVKFLRLIRRSGQRIRVPKMR